MAAWAFNFLSRTKLSSSTLFLLQSLRHSHSVCHRLLSTHAPPDADDVNEICRVLSDHRGLHHDLEHALTPFSCKVSTDLVEQVLKRTSNLEFAAHRFFLWANKFPDFQPSVVNYRILIGILGASKQFPLIWALLIEMRETEGLQLSPDLFWLVFGLYVKANLPGDAIRAFNRMADFGLSPKLDDLDHLLYTLCKRKFVSNAQEFYDSVKLEFPPSAKTYSILIRGWGDVGDSVRAGNLFDEMLKRDCTVDVPAYNSLLEALCKGGNVEQAYQSFRKMKDNGVEPNAGTYSVFIRAYCEDNNVYSAFRVLDRMKRYDLFPNVYTYNCIIKRLCANEKIEEVYQLLDEMIAEGIYPDTWSYNTILLYHCNRCEVNRACKLVSRMEKESCMPDHHTYNMLLKALIRIGRFDKVKDVWDSMEARGFYPPVSTYAVMIHGLLKKKNKLEEACKYFEVMIDEGIPPYSTTIGVLRNRLVGLGLLELRDVLADKMERSSSCVIQELSKTLRGAKGRRRLKREDDDNDDDDDSELDHSEEDWVFSREK
ncbi:hypothetical protein V2J09_010187 [Rumex salicifolius]